MRAFSDRAPDGATIDAWAALALLGGREPAASRVAEVLTPAQSLMSWINLGEVAYIVNRRHGPSTAADVVRDLRQSVTAVLPTEDAVLAAALIKATHRVSYAGAFAATTAVTNDAILLTGDPYLLGAGSAWRWEDLR